MAGKRRTVRFQSDSLLRARAPGAKPPRFSFIKDGVKYKAGCAPVRVCPAPSRSARAAVRGMIASRISGG